MSNINYKIAHSKIAQALSEDEVLDHLDYLYENAWVAGGDGKSIRGKFTRASQLRWILSTNKNIMLLCFAVSRILDIRGDAGLDESHKPINISKI